MNSTACQPAPGTTPASTADLDIDFDLAIAERDLRTDIQLGRERLTRVWQEPRPPELVHEAEAVTELLADLEGLLRIQAARSILRRRVRQAKDRAA